MTILRIGDTGSMVAMLQKSLIRAGFPCGKPDGDFGDGTKSAVIAFQKSKGLLADGVAGSKTLAALNVVVPPDVPATSLDHTKYFTVDFVKKLFPITPLKNIVANLPGVLDGLREQGLTSAPMILMALGTIRAEIELFIPAVEGISKYNTSPNGKPFDLYDNRHDLGNRGKPDGKSFCGRGYVQLTGLDNYLEFGKILGIDLVNNPQLACDPRYAGKILAAFIHSVERKAKEELLDGDLRGARKLVNGGSHGLDRFADTYIKGMQALPADVSPEYRDNL